MGTPDMSEWQSLCKLSDLQDGQPINKTVGDITVGLYRVGDNCYAINDICPHALAYLSDGFQEGDVIECPLHQARFSVVTGKCLDGPIRTVDTRVFETKLEGDEVCVRLPAAE